MPNLLQKLTRVHPNQQKKLPTNQRQLGFETEQLAKKYLIQKGYKFVTQNYYSPCGEIDLIFFHHQTIVFVEVKARSNRFFGSSTEAVTAAKLSHLIKTACFYQTQHHQEKLPSRIDLIAIDLDQHPPHINHIENISQ